MRRCPNTVYLTPTGQCSRPPMVSVHIGCNDCTEIKYTKVKTIIQDQDIKFCASVKIQISCLPSPPRSSPGHPHPACCFLHFHEDADKEDNQSQPCLHLWHALCQPGFGPPSDRGLVWSTPRRRGPSEPTQDSNLKWRISVLVNAIIWGKQQPDPENFRQWTIVTSMEWAWWVKFPHPERFELWTGG